MAEIGWIKLHRKLQDCWIWQIKPYDKARAWVDLLLLVMHHDKKMSVEDKPITIKRGSYFISRGKLADRWGWSIKKVDAYLNTLENEKMVTTIRTRKGTIITIVNYEEYQIEGTTQDTTEDTPQDITEDISQDTPHGTSQGTQNKNNKELKNNKNNNIKQIFVPPTIEEVQAYCKDRNNKVDAQAFVDFYSSKGWMIGKNKMKDWKAAVRTWERSKSSAPQKNNKFNNFSQRQYDFDEMEKRLINNNK